MYSESGLVPSPSLFQNHVQMGMTSFEVYVSDVIGRRFEKVKNGHIFENWTSIRDWTSIWVLHIYIFYFFMPPRRRVGGILIYLLSVHPSGYRYLICPAVSSYSFGATTLIFCRMFIHIMEVCMSTGLWFSTNILKMTGSWTSFLTSYIEHHT